jgi:hypothetical protein
VSIVRKTVVLCLVALALAATVASPASADAVRFSEGGAPIITGKIHGEDEHGVLHCRAVAEFIGESTKGASGVAVVRPGERWLLAAPKGGFCEEVFEVFAE